MIQFKNYRVLLIVAGLTCFNFTFAQISGGARLGINASNLRGSSVQNNSMLIGYNIGGFVNAGAEDILNGDIAEILSLQAELTVETKGATMDYPTIVAPVDTLIPNVVSSKVALTYVTIPILVKFTFGDTKGLNYFGEAGLYGGGLFGVTVDGEKKYDHDFDGNSATSSDKRNYRDDFDGFDIGMIIGGGASIPFGGRKSPWRAYGNLRYSFGFSSVGEYRENTPESFEAYVKDIKVSAISLLFGFSYSF